MLVLKLHDGKNPGKMSNRDGFELAAPITCCSRTPGRKGKAKHSEVEKRGKYRSMKSYDQNLSGKDEIVGKFMDRRRHLHLRQLGGNLKTDKNDMHGKIGMDDGNGKNEYSFLAPSVTLQDSCTLVFFLHFAYRHQRMSWTRRGVKTEHLTVRT